MCGGSGDGDFDCQPSGAHVCQEVTGADLGPQQCDYSRFLMCKGPLPREVEPITIEDAQIIWENVLKKAVEDYKCGGNTKRTRKNYEDAKRWMWSDSEDFPSFLFVCSYFGIEPQIIRQKLLQYVENLQE